MQDHGPGWTALGQLVTNAVTTDELVMHQHEIFDTFQEEVEDQYRLCPANRISAW